MPTWLIWAAAVAAADVLLVLFVRGANLKETDRESRQMRARTLSWKDWQ